MGCRLKEIVGAPTISLSVVFRMGYRCRTDPRYLRRRIAGARSAHALPAKSSGRLLRPSRPGIECPSRKLPGMFFCFHLDRYIPPVSTAPQDKPVSLLSGIDWRLPPAFPRPKLETRW